MYLAAVYRRRWSSCHCFGCADETTLGQKTSNNSSRADAPVHGSSPESKHLLDRHVTLTNRFSSCLSQHGWDATALVSPRKPAAIPNTGCSQEDQPLIMKFNRLTRLLEDLNPENSLWDQCSYFTNRRVTSLVDSISGTTRRVYQAHTTTTTHLRPHL